MVRRITFIALLICLGWRVVGAVATEMELKPKLACLPFVSLNVDAMAVAENLSSVLANSIDRTGNFETVERRKIEGMIELAGLKINNLTTDDLYRVGREAGLDFLVSGTVKRAGSGMTVEVLLLSMRAGKIYYADTFQANDYEIVSRMQQVTAEIIAKTKECILEGRAAAQDKKPLAVPFDVEVSGTSSSLRLKWKHADCSPAVVFKVFRAAREVGPFVNIATSTEPAYTDGNLRVNETFYYRVKAVNSRGGESEFSQTVMGKTALAPPPPILLSVDAEVKGAVLSWRPRPADDSDVRTVVAGYRVYRKGIGDKEYVERARCPREAITYRDSGLEEKKHYTYAVVSFNGDGTESEFSTSLDVVAVPPIDGVRVEAVRKRRVGLRWAPSLCERVEGYAIYRSDRQDGGYDRVGTVSGREMTAYGDQAPESCKTYWYRIAAYNREGVETTPAPPVAVTTEGKLPVPAGIMAINGQTRKVTIYWQPVGTPADGIKGYQVYRAENDKGPFRLLGDVTANITSFTDESALGNGTTYFYKVGSFDDGGDLSPLSEPVAAITKGVPRAPDGLRAVSGEVRQVTLSWGGNSEPDIEKYEIYRGPADETTVSLIDSVTVTSYVDRGLEDGVGYNYAVKAVNKERMSSPVSTAVSARTRPLPKKPTNLRIALHDGIRMITWEPASDQNILRYNVYKKGFMGLSEKVATVETNSCRIDSLMEDAELLIKAQDDTGRESEGAAILLSR